jgi:hypothetical protein
MAGMRAAIESGRFAAFAADLLQGSNGAEAMS